MDGLFYIRYIQTFVDKFQPPSLDQSHVPVTSIKNYDWVSFADTLHSDSALFDGDRNGSKAVVMKNIDDIGEWMLAFEEELVDTVCVYNINPAEACSVCPYEKFCRFAGSKREETECVCQNKNEGELCEVDLCSHCQNGGFCEINNETKEIQCKCPYPFYGEKCGNSSILLLNWASSIIINSLGKLFPIHCRLNYLVHRAIG